MPAAKPISKDMCLTAMDKTKSVKAAARYLNCSYHHLKRYVKLYVDEETGKTLFDKHKNQQGKGIPKFLRASGKEPALVDIICLLYTSPSPRDRTRSRMPSSA